MCEMSNRPATLRTAKCSSRIDVYCCGSSQPPKSTMRPPSAAWRLERGVLRGALGVKFGALVVIVVEVDRFRVDQGEHLFVIAETGFSDHAGDVERPVDRPLELLGELRGGRVAVKLAFHHQLGALVVGGSGNEELAFMD